MKSFFGLSKDVTNSAALGDVLSSISYYSKYSLNTNTTWSGESYLGDHMLVAVLVVLGIPFRSIGHLDL